MLCSSIAGNLEYLTLLLNSNKQLHRADVSVYIHKHHTRSYEVVLPQGAWTCTLQRVKRDVRLWTRFTSTSRNLRLENHHFVGITAPYHIFTIPLKARLNTTTLRLSQARRDIVRVGSALTTRRGVPKIYSTFEFRRRKMATDKGIAANLQIVLTVVLLYFTCAASAYPISQFVPDSIGLLARRGDIFRRGLLKYFLNRDILT